MNRSLCKVMMGVAGLVVLGMTATRAGAQTDEAFAIPTAELPKEKPPLYRYESYWAFPRAHWGNVDKDNATGNQKILAPALADGTIVEYEIDRESVHSTESAGQFILVFVTPKAEGRDKYNATHNAALYKNALLAPAKASILFDETPHDDWVRVNVTYK
jgi:hypothetical protein